jgi:hypothetical protein
MNILSSEAEYFFVGDFLKNFRERIIFENMEMSRKNHELEIYIRLYLTCFNFYELFGNVSGSVDGVASI